MYSGKIAVPPGGGGIRELNKPDGIENATHNTFGR
jgi:hypothetical protein